MTSVSTPADPVSLLEPVKATEKTLFWLGAGYSRCLNPNAPLMDDFFSGFDCAQYPHLAKYLSSRYENVAGVNVEDVLLAVEQIETCPLPPRTRAEMMCGQDPQRIKVELEKLCVERLSYDVPNYGHWAVNLLAMANELTTVVTTNYDVLPEQILRRRSVATHCSPAATCHHCNMRAILEDKCGCHENGHWLGSRQNAALLKIHGSIAWRTCRNKACGIIDCLKSSCDCSAVHDPKCECCGEDAESVIILPAAKKSYERYPQISRMWDLADDALAAAVAITIFGFSFPRSDTLIHEMFRSTIARSRKLKELFILDVKPKAVWERMKSVIPDYLKVSVHLLEVPPDGSNPEWIG
jgi:NAD-dependent SIR2 family protein deacetylase